MPEVNGKKYSYTKKGIADAKKEVKKNPDKKIVMNKYKKKTK
jgi:hypothetical protein